MPVVSIMLKDVEQSVSRPIVLQVARQVIDLMSLSESTQIRYAGKSGVLSNFGTTVNDNTNRRAKFSTDRLTYLEVTDRPVLESINETHVHDNEFKPFFNDWKIGLSLRPVLINTEFNMKISYRSNSRDEASRWGKELFIRKSRGREMNLHTVSYSYSIPTHFLEAVYEAWKLREAVEPYHEDFSMYLRQHTDGRLSVVGNRAGEGQSFVVSELHGGIQGVFGFDGLPDDPQAVEGGMWEISVDYKFSLQIPEACFMRVPVIVHNQLMPDKYLYSSNGVETIDPKTAMYSRSMDALRIFQGNYNEVRKIDPYVRMPDFDDFIIDEVPTATATIFTALCAVDEEGCLMNLADLGDHAIDPDIIPYLYKERPYLCKLYKSLFHVGLYINEQLCNNDYLEIDENFNVKSKVKLNLREQHRVRFSMVVNLKYVDRTTLERLMSDPKAFVKVLGGLNSLLKDNPDFKELGDRKVIKPYEFSRVYELLTYEPLHSGTQGGRDPDVWRRNKFLSTITEQNLRQQFMNRRTRASVEIPTILTKTQ